MHTYSMPAPLQERQRPNRINRSYPHLPLAVCVCESSERRGGEGVGGVKVTGVVSVGADANRQVSS